MSLTLALMLLGGTDFGLDPAWKPVADPYAPGLAGKVQCQAPDPDARTCQLMTWFRPVGTGQMEVRHDQMGLASEIKLTLSREGAGWCGVVDERYRASARIVSNRPPYAPKGDKRFYVIFHEAVDALWKRKTCNYGYARADDSMLLETTTIDGEFAGGGMTNYLWIDPKAGWRLKAPPQG